MKAHNYPSVDEALEAAEVCRAHIELPRQNLALHVERACVVLADEVRRLKEQM